MNILCAVCTELFKPNDEIYSVPCGHLYHHKCLTQWLERSSSCPQCRQKAERSAVRRVFFNFSHDDSKENDPTVLQATVEKLKFQASLRNEELRECKAQYEMLLLIVENQKIQIKISEVRERSMQSKLTRAMEKQVAMREYTRKIEQDLRHLHQSFSAEQAFQRKIENSIIHLEGLAVKAKNL